MWLPSASQFDPPEIYREVGKTTRRMLCWVERASGRRFSPLAGVTTSKITTFTLALPRCFPDEMNTADHKAPQHGSPSFLLFTLHAPGSHLMGPRG